MKDWSQHLSRNYYSLIFFGEGGGEGGGGLFDKEILTCIWISTYFGIRRRCNSILPPWCAFPVIFNVMNITINSY